MAIESDKMKNLFFSKFSDIFQSLLGIVFFVFLVLFFIFNAQYLKYDKFKVQKQKQVNHLFEETRLTNQGMLFNVFQLSVRVITVLIYVLFYNQPWFQIQILMVTVMIFLAIAVRDRTFVNGNLMTTFMVNHLTSMCLLYLWCLI